MFFEKEHSFNEEEFRIFSGQNFSFMSHIHRSFELYMQTRGTSEVVIDKRTYILKSGQAVLIFPFQYHSYRAIENSAHNICIFSPDLVPDYYGSGNFIPTDNLFEFAWSQKTVDNPFLYRSAAYEICGEFDRGRTYAEKKNYFSQDKVVSLQATNGGSDFVIVNERIYYLNNLTATYESGLSKEITNSALLTTAVNNYNETHKNVTFTYEENGNQASITYAVKFFITEEYYGVTTSYDNKNLFNQYYYGCVQPLPNEGSVKLLVIPVWFSDSTYFFTTAQKPQILQDIEYTVNGNRPNTELKSLKQYYEAQSYGAITMDITVSGFYNSSTSYEDYTDYESSKINNTNNGGNNCDTHKLAAHLLL